MKRRSFLTLAGAGITLPLFSLPAKAADRVFYTPGLAEKAMADGQVVLLDFWTNWCSTCAAQGRAIDAIRAANPAYDKAITFITVDWDVYADSDLSMALQIPRRSTLVAFKGNTELGRIVAGTSQADIKALLDLALTAA
ncbi:MAG: thioredoxin family protein [bacterium]